ncbi:hypothetical protein [Thalassospira alkalitolerans]|uniref:Uncharacterized protein n=1 Tax=Thalassospira alkalitolerans TaxID=1293890 RepID=A0A1Y2LA71_9PROT|nr:hypothetical protein [Thalassospira alkalitolerans]OSQ47435.1 hypothetical protein TALK_12905 [Thalassospira alkalitolerans]
MMKKQQKLEECRYVHKTAELLGFSWNIAKQQEAPDFIITENNSTFGLEVTEIFTGNITKSGGAKLKGNEHYRQEQLNKIRTTFEAKESVKLHLRLLRSSANQQTGNITRTEICDILRALIAEKITQKEIGFSNTIELKHGGKIQITNEYKSRWYVVNDRAGFVLQHPEYQIQSAINKKNEKFQQYQDNAGDDIRLLIVANRTSNSGKIRLSDHSSLTVDYKNFKVVYFLSHPEEATALQFK